MINLEKPSKKRKHADNSKKSVGESNVSFQSNRRQKSIPILVICFHLKYYYLPLGKFSQFFFKFVGCVLFPIAYVIEDKLWQEIHLFKKINQFCLHPTNGDKLGKNRLCQLLQIASVTLIDSLALRIYIRTLIT